MAAITPIGAPLIVITGPTASGKSALAMKLAKQWDGEIICADSRTVYKDMSVGTAKPTVTDQAQVRHWLLDVALPGERFTAADFQRLARAAVADIRARGKVPFLVGGTGLYIDALVLDFQFGPEVDQELRDELAKLSVVELQSMIKKQHLIMPENAQNKRYLIRCIEKNNSSQQGKNTPDSHTIVIAIDIDRQVLRERIAARATAMLELGVVQETQHLLSVYGANNEAMSGNIYPLVSQYLSGDISRQELIDRFIVRDWRLAKRQLTWLRRHEYVEWYSKAAAEDRVNDVLHKFVHASQVS